MQETWVQFLGGENPLEEEMATHSSILAWRITWTEEPGGLQSPWGWQRVGHNWAINTFTFSTQQRVVSTSVTTLIHNRDTRVWLYHVWFCFDTYLKQSILYSFCFPRCVDLAYFQNGEWRTRNVNHKSSSLMSKVRIYRPHWKRC